VIKAKNVEEGNPQKKSWRFWGQEGAEEEIREKQHNGGGD